MKLKNKVAIVTGSSRGIGKAIALAFAREGANVVVNYVRSEDEAKEVVKGIEALNSTGIAIKADISESKDVENMVNKVIEKFGRIDVLVNNAGIGAHLLKGSDIEKWDKIMDVNLKGVFLCSQAVAKVMLKQKSGNIINISSIAGIEPGLSSLYYSISKAGVIMLTKCLALELAPYVRVNSIAPGYVKTPMMTRALSEEEIVKSIPLGRLGTPEDIANVAIFLASSDSDYITGQVIVVDGGKAILFKNMSGEWSMVREG